MIKVAGITEINDGKKDYILRFPEGSIVIEEGIYAHMGLTYEQMVSDHRMAGGILYVIAAQILNAQPKENTNDQANT